MTASLSGVFNLQEFTAAGDLGVGMRLYTYTYGTTTHKIAYTDIAGSVAHTYTADGSGGQYIALDARGELPAPLYLTVGSYDLTLKYADGSTCWTRRADPVDDVFVDLAASTGSSLVGHLPSGAGAVSITIQQQLRNLQSWSVNVMDAPFYAVGNGVADDTAKVQAALNSGALRVVIPASATVGVTALTMAANQTLLIEGKIKKLSGTNPVITVAAGCSVLGGEIDGNSVNCTGIAGSNTQNVRVDRVYLHNLGKVGIASYAVGSTNWSITNNRVTNCTEEGIVVEYTNNAYIAGNIVTTALHGIRWWGGDSNVSTIIGIYGLRIIGNICTSVMGGIWGSLGANIAVTGNHVESCTDVGIDFEGCIDFTCTGNVAYECANGCYAVFYGCSGGTFSGNSAKNIVSNGSGFYATTNATYTNARLVLSGNTFVTKGKCVYADSNANRSFSNSIITGNHFISTGGSVAISIIQNQNLRIDNNHITTVGSRIGIELQAVNTSTISNNALFGFSDPATVPASSGGIWLYQQSAALPSRYNVVEGNRIDSYVFSVVDECTGDVTKSDNLIKDNRLVNVYRTVGGTYSGVVTANTYIYSPSTAVTVTTF